MKKVTNREVAEMMGARFGSTWKEVLTVLRYIDDHRTTVQEAQTVEWIVRNMWDEIEVHRKKLITPDMINTEKQRRLDKIDRQIVELKKERKDLSAVEIQ